MFGNTISMMEKSMDYLWKKQEVTANNIANVDTPGYRRKRVMERPADPELGGEKASLRGR